MLRRFQGPSAAAAAAPRRGAGALVSFVLEPVTLPLCQGLSREKRKPENPQIFRLSFYNNRSAKDAQSEAEGILNCLLPADIIQNDIPPVRSF